MKYLRILVLLLAIATAGAYGYYKLNIEAEYDHVAPVITADTDELVVSVNDSDEDLLEGLTAVDDRDGDVTDSLVVESHSSFIGEGKRKINYVAFDEAGNVGTYTRTITYSDYTAPKFYLTQPLRISEKSNSISLLDYVTAEDCLDGDVTKRIKYKIGEESSYYYYNVGENLVSFQVSNSAGDTTVMEMYLEVVDTETYNAMTPLLSDYLIYLPVYSDTKFTPFITGFANVGRGGVYMLEDHVDEEEPEYVAKTNCYIDKSQLDLNTPGIYRVIYTARTVDPETEEKIYHSSVSMYVVVYDDGSYVEPTEEEVTETVETTEAATETTTDASGN